MINITQLKAKDKQNRELYSYAANALDKHFIICRFRVSFGLTLNGSGGSISVDNINDDIFYLSGGTTWQQLGAVVGAPVTGTVNASAISGGLTIDYATGNMLKLSASHGIAPGNYNVCDLVFNIAPQCVEFDINLVPSNSNGFPESLLDGNVNRFRVTEVDTMAVNDILTFVQSGNKSGGSDIDPIIERFTDEFGQLTYEIRFDNFTQYLYTDGSFFSGADSVKLWMSVRALPNALDPGTYLEAKYLTPDGHTGFFDEVFDATPTEFEITDVDLTVGGDPVTQVDHTQVTHFQIKVKKNDGSPVFTAADSYFGIGFFHILTPNNEGDPSNPQNPDWYLTAHVESNTMLCSDEALQVAPATTISGRFNSAGAAVDIENFQVFVSGGGDEATFVGDITPNAAYTALINAKPQSERGYRLAVKVEDYTLTGSYIRPVWLTASLNTMAKYVPPLGQWIMGFSQIDHNGDGLLSTPTFFPSNTEDDLKIEVTFKLPKETDQIANDEFFSKVHLSMVAQKFTGEFFRLEQFSFELGDFLPDETQPISGSVARGYKLPPSSDKNVVTIARDPSQDTLTEFAIKANYGVLLDWRYWLPLAGVNADFYGDETKNWFNYQNTDWKVGMFVELETNNGNYQNFLATNHKTYDDTTDITSTINFYLEDGVTAITKPISGQLCVVEAVHVAASPYLWVSANTWGQITVEPKEQSPRWMSSTVLPYGVDPQNPLMPLPGETGAQMTIVGDTAIIRCLFNPDLINWQDDVSFTSKIHGEARKGTDIDVIFNRTKLTIDVARKTSFSETERVLKECCEARKVVADLDYQSRSDVTAHWWAGDTVEFTLYKEGVATTYLVATNPIPNAPGWFSVQLNWYAIYLTDGAGCYSLKVREIVAGIETEYTIENYTLYKYSRDITSGEARLMVLYDFVDVKNGIDFRGSGLVDCVRFRGAFGFYQPNLQVDNATDYEYSREKVRRISRDTYEMKAFELSGKFMRLINYMLLHENICWFTDYNWNNVEYYLDLVHVIVEESPQVVHEDVLTRKVGMTCKFRAKLDNNISAFNSPNAAKLPPVINIEGNDIAEDTTVFIYVDGVLEDTVVVPFGDDATFNISG